MPMSKRGSKLSRLTQTREGFYRPNKVVPDVPAPEIPKPAGAETDGDRLLAAAGKRERKRAAAAQRAKASSPPAAEAVPTVPEPPLEGGSPPAAEVDPLHPTGRCSCCGEGTCDWCRTFGDRAEASPALRFVWTQRADGRWNAECPNSPDPTTPTTMAGWEEERRADAEQRHLESCPECIAAASRAALVDAVQTRTLARVQQDALHPPAPTAVLTLGPPIVPLEEIRARANATVEQLFRLERDIGAIVSAGAVAGAIGGNAGIARRGSPAELVRDITFEEVELLARLEVDLRTAGDPIADYFEQLRPVLDRRYRGLLEVAKQRPGIGPLSTVKFLADLTLEPFRRIAEVLQGRAAGGALGEALGSLAAAPAQEAQP